MSLFLRTPVLQRWLGRSTALITFTGRNTARTYTTPVTYARRGTSVVVLTRESRQWWRNLNEDTPVRMRLAGRDHDATATARVGTADDADVVSEFLAVRRFDAKAHGVPIRADGQPDRQALMDLLPNIVVARITLVD